ncbi:MAG: type III-A CRISPR-associated RAMP protein Csm4 [Candidatus Aenigmatarchaeota archaeon]
MKVVRIYPKTNFHTFLHSDTLWGNLIYAYRMLYGVKETSKLISKYLSEEPPFVVSSFFPLKMNKKNYSVTYFLPKPISCSKHRDALNPEEMAYMKEYKKVRYIDKETFEEFLKGNYDDNLLFERFYKWKKAEDELRNLIDNHLDRPDKNQELKNTIKSNKFNYIRSLNPTFNLHNSIDRMGNSTLKSEGRGQLYWEEEFESFGNVMKEKKVEYNVMYKKQSNEGDEDDFTVNGVYFLVEGKESNLINGPLNLLSHIGLGGNKSIGKGSFSFEIEEFSFHQPPNYNAFVSLSLFHPNAEDIEKLKSNRHSSFYDITTRIGKVGRDFNLVFNEKNPVICFTEGSSFFVKELLKGHIVPTAQYDGENKIYSNYLFFGVKANLRLQ